MSDPTETYRVLGDWGTSSSRFYLQDSEGRTVSRLCGAGVKFIDNCEYVFFDSIRPWTDQFSINRVALSGMVGSTVGWVESPYITAPVSLFDIYGPARQFAVNKIDFVISPGVRCKNPLLQTDLMRGEETQVVGTLSMHTEWREESLLCMPGTHSKWVVCRDNKIESFFTGLTGELFELLSKHSILIGDKVASRELDKLAFAEAAHLVFGSGQADLLHLLFSVRARTVTEDWSGVRARSYLSGLLIAADIKSAMGMLTDNFGGVSRVVIVGEAELSARYADALSLGGWSSVSVDSERATLLGLSILADTKWKIK